MVETHLLLAPLVQHAGDAIHALEQALDRHGVGAVLQVDVGQLMVGQGEGRRAGEVDPEAAAGQRDRPQQAELAEDAVRVDHIDHRGDDGLGHGDHGRPLGQGVEERTEDGVEGRDRLAGVPAVGAVAAGDLAEVGDADDRQVGPLVADRGGGGAEDPGADGLKRRRGTGRGELIREGAELLDQPPPKRLGSGSEIPGAIDPGHQVDVGNSLQEQSSSRIQAIADKYFSRAVAANVTFSPGPQPPDEDDSLAEAIYRKVEEGPATLVALQSALREETEHVADNLTQRGYLVTDERARPARWLPALLMAAVLAAGLMKIGVGLMRERPVVFLAIGCGITLITALGFLLRPWRTTAGDRLLASLQARHASEKLHPATAASVLLLRPNRPLDE